ncbi:hypothetical protein KPH14_008697 [Odynerus spinipes]|uniref:Uncharacterized protein n=1 Tax=Odynerus spinipes TaxID=1348599 RepID=A0AAD9RID2_9HYME|nr:hypothetical protein KPH14_008697 [Odynerus spinipes]
MDYHRQTGTDGDLRETVSSSPKIAIPKHENTKESVIKIKRPQGGGTVRSIPIKDYQNSIAYNIGTLRKSMAPQLQFESLVSEPEKNVPMFLTKQRKSIANNNNNNFDVRKRSTLPLAPEQWSRRCNGHENLSCRVPGKCPDTVTTKEDKNVNDGKSTVSVRKENHDSNDTANYFRRSYRRRLSSNCCNKMRECKGEKEFPRGGGGGGGHSNISTRGHVGQKIIVYEENARRSERNLDPDVEQRKHRPIGVPLVGMHNACGLPVVASWNEREIFQPLRTSSTMIGNFNHVHEGSRLPSNLRRRTHPKRRAPDPNRSNRTTLARHVKRSDSRRSTLRSSADNNASGKRTRRLSLKATNRATLSSKNSFKRTVRGGKYTLGKVSLTNTLDRKGFRGVAKRRTLYARDDGEEAVQALKNLCLNPLARNESQEDMIW